MKRNTGLLLVVIVLVAMTSVGYYEIASRTGNTTGTSAINSTDTFFASSCSITGIGGFEFRIVSDSNGASLNGETIRATDRLGCNSETQIVYLDNFSVGAGGWLTPVFPSQATPGGGLDFTVIYQGASYNFSSEVPPVGTACVTLRVPSGNVTTTTVMSGNCT
jgi:hypothetical protein